MEKSAALASLGLTGTEDPGTVARVYGQRLAVVQDKLIAATTDSDRSQHQTQLSQLVEAYECVTDSGRYTKAPVDDAATMMRPAGQVTTPSVPNTIVRMETGAVLSDRLEIGDLLGQGGMGNVYAARDRLKDEDVAIKVLRQELLYSEMARDRFLAEAKVSCNLSHPNIVRVYDVGFANGYYYFSMERLKGHNLRQRIEAHREANRDFSVAEVKDIAHQIIDALRYAHRYIVHRDLKPENIWLAEDGTVKLMDFGIARAYSTSQLTQTGMTLGTAYYMAPEQRVAAKEVDWRADQYALGVMLYELLSGNLPMGAVKPLESLRRDVPKRFARALMRAMSPKPQDRFASLHELLVEIDAPGRSATGLIAAAAGVAVMAGVAGWYFVKTRDAVPATTVGTTAPVATQSTAAPLQPAAPPNTQLPPQEPIENAPETPPSDATPALSEAPAVPVEQTVTSPAPAPVVETPRPATTPAIPNRNAQRDQCRTQCEREEAECRSDVRRSRQDCMRTVAFNSGGSGRAECESQSNQANQQCLSGLRECRAGC